MTYEEKRDLRLQISQLLADAGVNQKTIKDMVETEIKNKVDRAIEQCFNNIVAEKVDKYFASYSFSKYFDKAVKEELKNKVIQVVLKDCKSNEVEKISS